jgi:ribose-phosphate pyrophosphokinase
MAIIWHKVFNLHGSGALARSLCRLLDVENGTFECSAFPDGETYLRIREDVDGLNIVILADLCRPDRRTLPLLLLAETLRDLGARRVVLAAPYLPYMRQDKRFNQGEGITSRYFARLLSHYFDGLVTVDPHLHRYGDLSEIYSIPTRTGHAAPLIADWIAAQVDRPILVGPDSESEQWVSAVARQADAPFTVLTKTRHGDREVSVSMPIIDRWPNHTPVLVDDIISSGHTMLETLSRLEALGLPGAVCIGIHGIFAEGADTALNKKAARLVTSNAIPHPSNAIDIAGPLAESIEMIE